MTTHNEETALVDAAIIGRRSIRKFLDRPVQRHVVEEILATSSRAPSGTNMQPWQVHVIASETKDKLTTDLLEAHFYHQNEHTSDYSYYPAMFTEPYKSRRKKIGIDLYGLLGIEKGAAGEMKLQHSRNYRFFDAPIGMIFAIDRDLRIGSWLDYGMFLQTIMIAARARGLDTCPQAAFAQYHKIIRRHLDIDDNQIVVCGMSLGYADVEAVENQLVSEREPVAGFCKFHNI